jgi:hypothetical protein
VSLGVTWPVERISAPKDTKAMQALTTLLFSTALALTLGASSAHAEMKVVARSGVWAASAGTTSDTNKPMCQMHATSDIRSVYVKWTLGPGLFIHINKDTWKIPQGSEMPIAMRFDQEKPFKSTAKPLQNPRWFNWIEVWIKDEADARRFIDQFASADRMMITFGGNEGEWNLRLDGSDTIARKFSECIAALKKQYGNSTQPFDSETNKRPTQPFGSEQQPSESTTKKKRPFTEEM